jgi:hypothetical protein
LISICGSQFTQNTAVGSSGAAFLFAYGIDQIAINRTLFEGNSVTTANPGLAGALRMDAQAFVANSLFDSNDTAGQGGAVWMGRGPATFENVTFYGNHASLWGGAISYDTQTIALNNCTLVDNTADEGANTLFGNAGYAGAHNSLFANNGATAGPKNNCSVGISGSPDLAFPADASDTCSSSWIHGDPQVAAALANLGGATETLAIGATGAAIGVGTDCPPTDANGKARSAANCDLGAVEH